MTAKFFVTLATIAIINLFSGTGDAAKLNVDEKIFVEQQAADCFKSEGTICLTDLFPKRSDKLNWLQRRVVPPIFRRPLVTIGRRREPKPAKIYPSRTPTRPTPRFIPSRPKPSYDTRGGKRRLFG